MLSASSWLLSSFVGEMLPSMLLLLLFSSGALAAAATAASFAFLSSANRCFTTSIPCKRQHCASQSTTPLLRRAKVACKRLTLRAGTRVQRRCNACSSRRQRRTATEGVLISTTWRYGGSIRGSARSCAPNGRPGRHCYRQSDNSFISNHESSEAFRRKRFDLSCQSR